jgi:general secretion pathway protein G
MMMVLTLILILASFSLPIYRDIVVRAREAALRDDLYSMRSMIDRFTLDNRRPPSSLEELVQASYLGAIPKDPFTGSNETWQVEIEDVSSSPEQSVSGIVDVHSGSDQISPEGTPYSSW